MILHLSCHKLFNKISGFAHCSKSQNGAGPGVVVSGCFSQASSRLRASHFREPANLLSPVNSVLWLQVPYKLPWPSLQENLD